MAAVILLAAAAATAAPPSVEECERRLAPARIEVVVEPARVSYDLGRSVAELTRMSGEHRPRTLTLGLTHTTRSIRTTWGHDRLEGSGGLGCMRPALRLVLSVAPQTVFIGREFPPGSCAHAVVREHELRHVAANQLSLEQAAAQMRAALERELGGRLFVGDVQRLHEEWRRTVEDDLLPRLHAELDRVEAVHAGIDSEAEMQRMTHACDGEVQRRLPADAARSDAPSPSSPPGDTPSASRRSRRLAAPP